MASIPSDWFLCDGTNGTPDLTDKFVIGAGDTFAVGDELGVTTHQHAFTSDGHTHSLPVSIDIAGLFTKNETTSSVQEIGITESKSTAPPYYSLAYIMAGG